MKWENGIVQQLNLLYSRIGIKVFWQLSAGKNLIMSVIHYPEKNWPYVLPGPQDSWAGGGYWAGYYPRHFPSLYFQLDKTVKQGDCRFVLYFAGEKKSRETRIRIEINGHNVLNSRLKERIRRRC
ncbi:MAG: hypothetical protein V8S95_04165 [Odoribacter sp.]